MPDLPERKHVPSGARMAEAREDAKRGMEISRIVREAKTLEQVPIYWFSAGSFSPDIWKGVVEIYAHIFSPESPIKLPDARLLRQISTPTGGEVTFQPGTKNQPLEVWTKPFGSRLVMRFKAFDTEVDGPDIKSEEFDTQVNKFLLEKGLDLIPIGHRGKI
jgi:hypothetical protein